MKVLCPKPDDFSDKILSDFKKKFDCHFKNINQNKLDKIINQYDVILTRFNHKINFYKKNKIKFILSPTTGIDHIDEKYFRSSTKIITLKNEHKFLRKVNATSEFTIYLILKSLRSFLSKKKGFASELNGKTVGIIGYGRIGSKVSKILRSFNSKVLAYDTNKKKIPKKIQSSLNNLIINSDVISIHIPLNKKNYYFFNKKIIKIIKKNAIVINTSRGDVIDEKELLRQIRLKKIRYATDVYGQYLLKNVKKNDKIIYTKHVAGLTEESIELTDTFIMNKFIKLSKTIS